MKIKFLNGPAIGIDLGSRTIKGIKLKKKKGHVYLDRYFFHDLAQTSHHYPEEVNVNETLKANVEMSRFGNTKVASNIGDEDVFNLNFTLPKMTKSEMAIAVGHEIQDNLNIPITDLCFDYLTSEAPSANEVPQVNVKAYCVKRSILQERMATLRGVGLRPKAIESDMLAIMAMLDFNDYLTPKKNFAVFDLGESHVSSALISDGELVFTKAGKVACGSINRALKDDLKMSYMDGETQKLKYDFNQEIIPDSPTGKIIDRVYFNLFSEVKSSIEFFREQPNGVGGGQEGTQIDRILLVGGGSQIRNIAKVFELFFKIPTTVVNPFKNIQIYEGSEATDQERIGQLSGYMATAVGLALREIA